MVSMVALWCVLWWVFEPVPIPVTSLLPIALLPLMGVLTPAEVGQAYGSPLILLLLGGFLLSKAMEHSGAHRRIALGMVRLVGADSGPRLVLGFMIAAASLSMWISNTATTLMLLPVALAVLEATDRRRELAVPLLLGVAYAASVGGIGTPIGTPPNLIFMQVYEQTTGQPISFTRWMSWAVPVVVVMIPLMALMLTRSLSGPIAVQVPSTGAWRSEEKRVLTVFGLTALAWITRSEPFGGWQAWLGLPQANDASVALLAVVVMFVVPNGSGGRLLDWERASTIPWGVLLLFFRWDLPGQRFCCLGAQRYHGRGVCRLDRHACLVVAAVDLPRGDFHDGDHIQYSEHHAADAGARGCRAGGGSAS